MTVTTNEFTFIYHYNPESMVYISADSWCYTILHLESSNMHEEKEECGIISIHSVVSSFQPL